MTFANAATLSLQMCKFCTFSESVAKLQVADRLRCKCGCKDALRRLFCTSERLCIATANLQVSVHLQMRLQSCKLRIGGIVHGGCKLHCEYCCAIATGASPAHLQLVVALFSFVCKPATLTTVCNCSRICNTGKHLHMLCKFASSKTTYVQTSLQTEKAFVLANLLIANLLICILPKPLI